MFHFHTHTESVHTFRLKKQEESVLLSMVVTKVMDGNIFYFCACQGGNETTKRIRHAPLAGVPITIISGHTATTVALYLVSTT